MKMMKISISITEELDSAIVSAATTMRLSRSRFIENTLRENDLVHKYLGQIRKEPRTTVFAVPKGMKAEAARKRVKAAASAWGKSPKDRIHRR